MDDNKRSRENRKNRVIKTIALFFLVIGIFGWFIPFVDFLQSQNVEFPNSLPQGLFLDNKGNLFCGSQAYERIQMYDNHGSFIRAFSTDIGKGSGFHFTFDVKNNQLHIHVFGAWLKSERFDRKIVYSLDGKLLDATDIPSTEYTGYKVFNEFRDLSGNKYIFKGFLFPRVVKNTDKDSSIVVSTPIYFWPIQSPFPSFIFFFVALLYLAGFKNLFRKLKGHEPVNANEALST